MYKYQYTVLLPNNESKSRIIYVNSEEEVVEEIKIVFPNYIKYEIKMISTQAI